MWDRLRIPFSLAVVLAVLTALHFPLLRLPYFWDEAGYYIPAALDFYRAWLLIPESTLPTGHTPLVIVYLGLVWHLFGFSPLVTRTAMIAVAAATVVALYALGRRVAAREPAVVSALLLALSPLFFAQSSLAHLDLAVALFTTLAVLALLERRMALFALTASLAILGKETAVVLLPVAWFFAWVRGGARRAAPLPWTARIALTVPLLPLLAWTVYYHHSTGYWTGNAEYLQYNLYATLNPLRMGWTLLRRLYEMFIGGFHWLLAGGAVLGIWWGGRRHRDSGKGNPPWLPSEAGTGARPCEAEPSILRDFLFLAAELGAGYLLMLSVVGGAVLPRYLLPILPLFFLAAVTLVWRLPRALARVICGATAVCFVWGWFLNPPYPFPFEDNLAYADFVRLHQQAARHLEAQRNEPRILTAWPASDELTRPFLGYVRKPLRVVAIPGFTANDLSQTSEDAFDLLYAYSRKWEPPNNWLARFPPLQKVQERHFDYAPQVQEDLVVARYRLRLLAHFARRGQWVRIYSKQESGVRSQEPDVRSQWSVVRGLHH